MNDEFARKSDHFKSVKQSLGLDAIWSIYEIENLSDRHPYDGVKTVTYKDHWGDEPVVHSISGGTWAALYVAANSCIRDSGDGHHAFIENFVRQGDTLLLRTGS